MKLNFEFIPNAAIGQNLRNKPEWDILRKKVYDIYNGECQICRKQKCLLDAHEVWDWNEEYQIQKLVDIMGVCRCCHEVIHFDISEKKGKGAEAEKHYIKVNNCDYKKFNQDLEDAKLVNQRRNRIRKWDLNTTIIFQKKWMRRIFYPDEDHLEDFKEQKRCVNCSDFYHIEAMINNKCYSCAEEF